MKIVGKTIVIIAGDIGSFTSSCQNQDKEPIKFLDGDTVYFTVKENVNSSEITIQKIISIFDDGKAIIDLSSSDTRDLKAKEYVYDIRWKLANGSIITVVTPSKFIVELGVTTI